MAGLVHAPVPERALLPAKLGKFTAVVGSPMSASRVAELDLYTKAMEALILGPSLGEWRSFSRHQLWLDHAIAERTSIGAPLNRDVINWLPASIPALSCHLHTCPGSCRHSTGDDDEHLGGLSPAALLDIAFRLLFKQRHLFGLLAESLCRVSGSEVRPYEQASRCQSRNP